VVLGALVLGFTVSTRHWSTGGQGLTVGQAALLGLAFLALVPRHRWPLAAHALSCAAAASFMAAGGPPGPLLLAPFWGLLTVVVATKSWRRWLPAAFVGGAVLALSHGLGGQAPLADSIFILVWLLCATAAGAAVTVRQRFAAEVEARSRWAQHSRAEEERRLVAEERLRIAREVHDVVGHSLAVISLQAGVAEHLLDSKPEEVRRAVTAIRTVSRQALGELRAELASLRGGSPESGRAPTPALVDVPALVILMREAGLAVDLDLGPNLDELPAAVGAAAYRIVQESLTNVARHAASGARVRVELERQSTGVRVEVVDSVPDPGPAELLIEGHGISGMRERVTALGGRFQIERRAAGVRVWAHLPLAQL
jgi:signal transduction histidine kinase